MRPVPAAESNESVTSRGQAYGNGAVDHHQPEALNVQPEAIVCQLQAATVPYISHLSAFNNSEQSHVVPIDNLPGDVHASEQLSGDIAEDNPSPYLGQIVENNEGPRTVTGNTNASEHHRNNGAPSFFNGTSHIRQPIPLAGERQTMDWESGLENTRAFSPTTTQLLAQLPCDHLQLYSIYYMDQLESYQGADPMRAPTDASEVPIWKYKELNQVSQDPFSIFPAVDSLIGDATGQDWSNA
jgi:hypothetical protein